jgi:hypothetical protein
MLYDAQNLNENPAGLTEFITQFHMRAILG